MVDERCKASPRHQKVYQDTRVCKSHKQVNRAIGYVPGVRGVINPVSDGKRHRLIRPEDIASAALFFCSPLADIVTGQSIAVDGGSAGAVMY